MFGLFDSLIVFISTLLAVIVLGVVASFSPVLYATQIASGSSRKKKSLHTALSLMAGVIAALLLLMVLFQAVNVDTLLRIIDTTLSAVFISMVFNVLFGVFLIGLGAWYLQKADRSKNRTSPPDAKKSVHVSALFGFGFGRTMLSVSGLSATYVAGNAIAATSIIWLEQLVYTVIFLIAAIAPFFVIWILAKNGVPFLPRLYDTVKAYMQGISYRTTLGYSAILLGVAVVILNIMLGLFAHPVGSA